MKAGMSANTLGIDRTAARQALRKKLIIFGLGFMALFIAVIAAAFYMNSRSALKTKQFTNGSYTYTITFYQAAKPVTVGASTGLRYGEKVTVSVSPTTDAYLRNCTHIGRAWKESFSVQIDGKERPVCTTNDQSYYTNFESAGNRHVLMLTYSKAQSDTTETITTIMQSVKVKE